MPTSLLSLIIERDTGRGQVVEQGLELLVIKRQPMLHPDIAPAGADRFVERVVGAGRPELLAVARAEAAHRLVVEQHLADRAQYRLLELAGRTLGQSIEA